MTPSGDLPSWYLGDKGFHAPALYRDATIDSWLAWADVRSADGRCQADVKRRAAGWAAACDRDFSEIPPLVVMYGGPGTGKNHMAWGLVRHAASTRGVGYVFATFADIVRDLRGAWGNGDGGPSEAQRLKRYRDVDLLVIDELSPHALTAKQIQQPLYDLVAFREQWMKATIITTNAKQGELSELLGPALASRIVAWDGCWAFGAADFRIEKARLHRGGRRPDAGS